MFHPFRLSFATFSRLTVAFVPSGFWPVALVPSGQVWPPLGVVGDGQLASVTCCERGTPVSWGLAGKLPRVPSCPVGDTHPENPLSDVRGSNEKPVQPIGKGKNLALPSESSRVAACNGPAKDSSLLRESFLPDARSRNINRCAGEMCSFQVSENSIDPCEFSFAFSNSPSFRPRASDNCLAGNLLADDDGESAGSDEVEGNGPEMTLVGFSEAKSGTAEGLAWTGAGANRSSCWPAGELQRERPSTNAGKEMHLSESIEVFRFEIDDAAGVNDARRDQSIGDQFAQPCRGARVVLIVKMGH